MVVYRIVDKFISSQQRKYDARKKNDEKILCITNYHGGNPMGRDKKGFEKQETKIITSSGTSLEQFLCPAPHPLSLSFLKWVSFLFILGTRYWSKWLDGVSINGPRALPPSAVLFPPRPLKNRLGPRCNVTAGTQECAQQIATLLAFFFSFFLIRFLLFTLLASRVLLLRGNKTKKKKLGSRVQNDSQIKRLSSKWGKKKWTA